MNRNKKTKNRKVNEAISNMENSTSSELANTNNKSKKRENDSKSLN